MAFRFIGKDIVTMNLFILLCSLVLTTHGANLRFDITEEDKRGLPMILWWDGLGLKKDYISECKSGISCLVSNNKSNHHRDDLMVYAFYASNFLSSGLPFPRQEGDIWAFIHEESPKNSDWLFSFESTLELFNYTSTFKRESDYPLPTHWLSSEEFLMSTEHLVSTEEKNKLRDEGRAPIIFVHSDCTTPSNRERYIGELMKHIDVDSYGSCLHNKDFPEALKNLSGYEAFGSKDFYKFVAGYKFSIAFENAICDDYITEKLWRPLHVGSVPIVYGSSKIKDFLPSEKSALVINDFDSIKDLAVFIDYLDNNDDEYNAFLQFKHTGIQNPTLTSEITRMRKDENNNINLMTAAFGFECFLCTKLHEAKEAIQKGKPVDKSQATLEHFDCPLPTRKFDEQGKLVPDSNRVEEIKYYKEHAKAFRDFYDMGKNITAEELYKYTLNLIRSRKSQTKDEL